MTKHGRTERDANNAVSELVTTMHYIAVIYIFKITKKFAHTHLGFRPIAYINFFLA